MALFDDILSGNWVTGLAIGVGAVVVLPLAAPYPPTPGKDCDQGRHSGLPGTRPECSEASVISSLKLWPRAARRLPRRRWKWLWKR